MLYKVNTQKNPFYCYTLIMKNYKLKFKKNVIYNEILRYKSNKPCWEQKMMMKIIKKDLNKWGNIVFTG